VAKQKQRCAKENIMAELKIGGMTLDEIREAMKGDGKTRFFGKTKEEIQANRRAINESFLPKTKTTPGNIASRTDFSDEKMGPKFKVPKKITKEKVSVETPSGDIGSVDRTADVIGPDMSKVIKDVVATKPAREFTATEMAQNLMSPGYNKMKKGGAVKKMSSGGKVSSASKRADGIATKGKTRGKIC
jgi:hypothetical protein